MLLLVPLLLLLLLASAALHFLEEPNEASSLGGWYSSRKRLLKSLSMPCRTAWHCCMARSNCCVLLTGVALMCSMPYMAAEPNS
jgi:hypothetical protein